VKEKRSDKDAGGESLACGRPEEETADIVNPLDRSTTRRASVHHRNEMPSNKRGAPPRRFIDEPPSRPIDETLETLTIANE